MKLSKRYEAVLRSWGTWDHAFVVEGALGAVHLHLSEGIARDGEARQYHGAVEYHHTTPRDGEAPTHGVCRAVSSRPCWFVPGSATWVSESWGPRWDRSLQDMRTVQQFLAGLEQEYLEYFHPEDHA